MRPRWDAELSDRPSLQERQAAWAEHQETLDETPISLQLFYLHEVEDEEELLEEEYGEEVAVPLPLASPAELRYLRTFITQTPRKRRR